MLYWWITSPTTFNITKFSYLNKYLLQYQDDSISIVSLQNVRFHQSLNANRSYNKPKTHNIIIISTIQYKNQSTKESSADKNWHST